MNFETNLEIYREYPINFSKATSCRYVLNVDISGMLGNRLESLRVKQSGAFDLIYDTNFMEKSSNRSSIRSERRKRKICSNVAGYRNRSGGKTIGSPANETASDEQTSVRKYLSRRSINGNGLFAKKFKLASFTSCFVASNKNICSPKKNILCRIIRKESKINSTSAWTLMTNNAKLLYCCTKFFFNSNIKNRINFMPTCNIYNLLQREIERKSLQNFLLEMKL